MGLAGLTWLTRFAKSPHYAAFAGYKMTGLLNVRNSLSWARIAP